MKNQHTPDPEDGEEELVKSDSMPLSDSGECPTGYYLDTVTGTCVLDSGHLGS